RTEYVAFSVAGVDTHPRYSATFGTEEGNDGRRKIDVDVVLTEHLREESGHEAGTKGQWVRAIRPLPALRRRGAAESGNAGMVGDDGVFGGSGVVCVGAEVGGPAALEVHVGVRRADWKVRRDEKPVAPFLENRTVDDRAGEITAFGQGTWCVIVVVGEIGNDFPLDRPNLLPMAHRCRSDSEPAHQSNFIEHFGMGCADGADVFFRTREVVVDAYPGGHVVRADPHLAARPCGRAADLVARLQDNGAAAAKSGHQ